MTIWKKFGYTKLVFYLVQTPIILWWAWNINWLLLQKNKWQFGKVILVPVFFPLIYLIYFNIAQKNFKTLNTDGVWGQTQCFSSSPGEKPYKDDKKCNIKGTTKCPTKSGCKICFVKDKYDNKNWQPKKISNYYNNCIKCKSGYQFIPSIKSRDSLEENNCLGSCIKNKQPKYNYEGKMNLLCLLDQRKTLSDMSELLGSMSYNSAYVILLLGILTSLLPSKYNAFNNNIIRHFSIILLMNYLMLLAFSASGISNIYQVFLSAPLVLLYSTQIASLVIVILGFIYRIKFMKHIKFY